MGVHNISTERDEVHLHEFTSALLADLSALERMIKEDRIESGVKRIGAEQEIFLVDRMMRPAPVAVEVLKRAGDARLTTEIAQFNLEANLTPREFTHACFSELEREIEDILSVARRAANECEADLLLTGILPTLKKSDLSVENLTQAPRYHELNRVVTALRGGAFSIHIKGVDELYLEHDNVMMEACNTSFQVHLQVNALEFVPLYNFAQAITAPVLASAVNSPLLFNYRLWQETRLALFQHSVDARSSVHQARRQPPRVQFGRSWLEDSIVNLFREDIVRYRVIMTTETDEDPLTVLNRGDVPQLSALRLHNGTVWRWNRPCYGILNGKAHLRIENRALPSGPTVRDEVANAAFFLGLMAGLPAEYGDITRLMAFDDAKANFYAAARHGLRAQLIWLNGKIHTASALILDHLLPLARAGLKEVGIEPSDIDLYLSTIEERVRSGRTGAQWMLDSLAVINGEGTADTRARRLTHAMLKRQKTGETIHQWMPIEKGECEDWSASYQTVGQFMSTDLFTVRADDLVDLAASVMDWRHVRHVPVEDDAGRLVGLVSHRALLRLLSSGRETNNARPIAVREIMKINPVTVSPQTPTLEAIALMRNSKVGCLPVVEEDTLVGIVTAHDFLSISARLFEEHLNKS